jgi:hypothetical protein
MSITHKDICHCHRCGGDWLKTELLDTGACPACPKYKGIYASISIPVMPRDKKYVKTTIKKIKERLCQ